MTNPSSHTPLRRTPLHSCHLELKGRMVPFAGYEMPVQYSGLLEEAKCVRSHGGLFDVSHMGQISLRGKNTLPALQALVTNDLSKIALGQAQYNLLLNEQGGVIDDLIVYRRSEEHTYLCVNASNREEDFAWIRGRLPKSVDAIDESDATALIAVQGPQTEALLSTLAPQDAVRNTRYYWATESKILDLPCYLSRTGYTGEDGFEIYLDAKHAVRVWTALLENGSKLGFKPAGLGARDTLRLEMGYPLHGHEITADREPLASGLDWVVKLNLATSFTGQAVLKRLVAEGPQEKLLAFVVQDRRTARQGYPIVLKDRTPVGAITSGTFSPHRNAPIALGFVKSLHIKGELFSQVRDDLVPLQTVSLPFVPSRVKKN